MYKNEIPADLIARSVTVEERAAREATRCCETVAASAGELETALEEARERHVRLAADFDNYKKRMARELEERSERKSDALVRTFLGAMDNFDRAMTKDAAQGSESFQQGVGMIYQQLLQTLKEFGFDPREDLNKPFDPAFHEAVAVKSDASRETATVLQVWERGWMKNGKLFRPSKVLVNQLEEDLTALPRTIP